MKIAFLSCIAEGAETNRKCRDQALSCGLGTFFCAILSNSERNSADTFVSIFAFSLTLCYDFVTIAYANS